MAPIIPQKLTKGDTIGVIAPSEPISPEQEQKLKAGCTYLKQMGLNVHLGSYLSPEKNDDVNAPKRKAKDINDMFADPSIKGIICAQGGETANTTLPFIDWSIVKKNPKIFLGLSDITVLLNAIYKKTIQIVFHGNDILWGFGNNLTPYEEKEFTRILIHGAIGAYPTNQMRKTIRGGQALGRLIGGNLGCMLKLAGTPYWPDLSGAILFIEEYQITAKACQSAFYHLQQMGVFDQIKGVILGYIDSMEKVVSPKPHMEDILLQVTESYHFPILKMNDFGHNCPNTILPVGGEVYLDADRQILEITQPCVR